MTTLIRQLAWMPLTLILTSAAPAAAEGEKAGADKHCEPPSGAVMLNETALRAAAQLVFGEGQVTCNSSATCFPDLPHGDKQGDVLPLQLLPIDLPFGAPLSVSFNGSFLEAWPTWSLPITLYKVTADDFRLCNVTRGLPVLTAAATNGSVHLNMSLLSPGHHFLVLTFVNDTATACLMGQRVHVTIKPIHCPISGGHICTTSALCITRREQDDYSCFCCGANEGDNCRLHELCPCQNGGHCQTNLSAHPNIVQCECRYGFHGALCEKRASSMCEVAKCQNNGTCTGNATHFRCACAKGYNGSHCEVNVNECSPNPCVNGLCVDGDNGYSCYCAPGFHGHHCELDYNECATAPCLNEGFCQDLQDNYTCHCHPGYTGRNCSNKINTCDHLQPCRNGATCQELMFGYRCHCRHGFTGAHCEVNVNDCAGNPCLNGGSCVDQVNGYRCYCLDMHAGPNCQYPLDMFGPMIDIRGLRGGVGPEARAFHVRNMYVVSGTLSCAIVVVLAVLVTCYCRVRGATPYSALLRRHNKYSRHHDVASNPVDISSVSDPRLTVDAIWEATSLNYDVTQLGGSPARQASLRALEV